MQTELTPGDVRLYLAIILGAEPVPDADGMVHLRCVFPFEPPHEIHMNIQTGRWVCQGGHGRRELDDFESGRSRLFGLHTGENAVLRIIREAKEKSREAEEARKAARERQVEDLGDSVRHLLRLIDRHPEGIARRSFQQRSHMSGSNFRKGLRELMRRGLIRLQRPPKTRPPGTQGGRPKLTYFPVFGSESPTQPRGELAPTTCEETLRKETDTSVSRPSRQL